MPQPTRGHSLAFHENDQVFLWVGIAQYPELAVKMIEGDVENALHHLRLDLTATERDLGESIS